MINCKICGVFLENINCTEFCDKCNELLCYVDNDINRLISSMEAVYNYIIQPPIVSVFSAVVDVFPVAKNGYKQCSNKSCKHILPAITKYFNRRGSSPDGLDSWCKECKRDYDKWYHLKKTHGVDKERFYQMLNEQNNCCGICKRPFDLKSPSPEIYPQILRPEIQPNQDHSHATDVRRGLLCKPCNFGLGNFNDDIEMLQNAIRYLKKYQRC